jgi:hypothetical protein
MCQIQHKQLCGYGITSEFIGLQLSLIKNRVDNIIIYIQFFA